jgi:hypothetical protein
MGPLESLQRRLDLLACNQARCILALARKGNASAWLVITENQLRTIGVVLTIIGLITPLVQPILGLLDVTIS